MAQVLPLSEPPESGDVLLARIEKIGKNARIELTNGRASNLYEGDLVAVVLGNRYATEQFEGYARVRGNICHLLSMGGLCGIMESRHAGVIEPSSLRVLGSLGNALGEPLCLSDYCLGPRFIPYRPKVLAVCGSSMDVGKTYTARSLVLGLRKLGLQVAGIKLTGTATGRDTWSMIDAGARPALDFLDGGLPSTYLCSLEKLLALYDLLVNHAAGEGAEWVVMEIADGLLQRETASLLHCKSFISSVHAWLYAAGDGLNAVGGVAALRSCGVEPVAISGVISMSPLAIREAAEATGVRCVTAQGLQLGELNPCLLSSPPTCLMNYPNQIRTSA